MSHERTIPRKCLGCGCDFLAESYLVKRGVANYCGVSCRNQFGNHGNPVGYRGSAEERFWAKVDKTPGQGPKGKCWTWTGARNRKGYGVFAPSHGKCVLANRFAWTLDHGEIPDGMGALHHCDNPPCVRCLFLGNDLDNVRDRESKGRTLNRKLTEAQVREIKARLARGELQRTIAPDYGICRSMVGLISTGAAWDHVA